MTGSHVELEQFLRVVFEDQLLVGVAEPVEGLNQIARLIQPFSGARILDRSDARPLRTEQTSIRAHRS